MTDNILNHMCEISGMFFSILAVFVASNNQVPTWTEVGSHIVFAFITGLVGGLAGLLVKLIWNKIHKRSGQTGHKKAS